jgi:hypothetical protein
MDISIDVEKAWNEVLLYTVLQIQLLAIAIEPTGINPN